MSKTEKRLRKSFIYVNIIIYVTSKMKRTESKPEV